jgi:hypothetical protein
MGVATRQHRRFELLTSTPARPDARTKRSHPETRIAFILASVSIHRPAQSVLPVSTSRSAHSLFAAGKRGVSQLARSGKISARAEGLLAM